MLYRYDEKERFLKLIGIDPESFLGKYAKDVDFLCDCLKVSAYKSVLNDECFKGMEVSKKLQLLRVCENFLDNMLKVEFSKHAPLNEGDETEGE